MVTTLPYKGALEMINDWYDNGHIITFFTSRNGAEHWDITSDWLKNHGFRYHHLLMDKPVVANTIGSTITL